VAALRTIGIDDITVVEPHQGRRRLARDLGVTAVVDPGELEVFPSWEPERMSSRAVHVVLECSGHKAAIEAGFHQLARGGILVMVGAGIEHPTFDINRMILNELSVTGSFVYDLGGFERALELLATEGFPADLLIDPDDVSLAGIGEALEGLAVGRIAGKVMVVPEVPS
jgi:threonine dehydrogenase-like Zn-dependent dehydrogenase